MKRIPQRPFFVNETEYPYKSNWFETNNYYLHYLDEGQGLPVLMIHGNPAWSFLYRKVINQLNGSCRKIAPDLPGFGFSDHPPNYNYSPQEHGEWISGLIDHLSLDKFILVVQDWGGPIGMSIAVNRPDQVAGLVISNTFSWKPDYLVWSLYSFVLGSRLGNYLIRRHNIFMARILPTMFNHSELRTPEILKAYRAPFITPNSRTGMIAFARALTSSNGWLNSIENKLHRLIDKPIELIFGMKDPFFSKDYIINRWQKHFPKASLNQVPDAGHFIEEDRPEIVVEAIERILNHQMEGQ